MDTNSPSEIFRKTGKTCHRLKGKYVSYHNHHNKIIPRKHTYNLRPKKLNFTSSSQMQPEHNPMIKEFDVITVLNQDEGKDTKPRPEMTNIELEHQRKNLIYTKNVHEMLKKYSAEGKIPPKWFMNEMMNDKK